MSAVACGPRATREWFGPQAWPSWAVEEALFFLADADADTVEGHYFADYAHEWVAILRGDTDDTLSGRDWADLWFALVRHLDGQGRAAAFHVLGMQAMYRGGL